MQPMTMIPKMICPVLSSAWLSVIMWPMPEDEADQLGHDHIGPGPAQHQPQDFGDLRRRARNQHAAHDAARRGAERVGGLHQILRAPPTVTATISTI